MRKRLAMLLAGALLSALLGSAAPVSADESSSTVIDWNRHATDALFNAPTASTPGAGQGPVGSVHLAMVQIAVYDAINAIVGGHEPYLTGLPAAPSTASQDAAAAVAAHHVLVGLGTVGNAPSIPAAAITRLDDLLAATLADVPAGADKLAGIAIGAAAAAAILADRSSDGRGGPFRFTVGTLPGEWRPTSGVNDPFAWVKDVRPFTLRHGAQFISEGPPALDSEQYAIEFNEVKATGSATGSTRTDGQTATALYFTENPFTLFSRTFRAVAGEHDLSGAEAARLFAMTSVGGADALIACWNNKARWSNWRPVTAIALAADDGNPATMAQPGWTSLVVTPPYPDNTSGYNCVSGGQMYAARAFFGTDKLPFALINASNVTREYARFSDVLHDTIDARVWLGIHFRFADVQGAWVGKKVGQWLGVRFFGPAR
ncbi:MAG TPA: vanadium-dependent haloperoxidase [Candidatus Limnocylindrales bacterium]|nr:vanadium-dependent haloperoxidase [Candidatus Limnocylindrales bacterium]